VSPFLRLGQRFVCSFIRVLHISPLQVTKLWEPASAFPEPRYALFVKPMKLHQKKIFLVSIAGLGRRRNMISRGCVTTYMTYVQTTRVRSISKSSFRFGGPCTVKGGVPRPSACFSGKSKVRTAAPGHIPKVCLCNGQYIRHRENMLSATTQPPVNTHEVDVIFCDARL
jgi:hypothetical protein